MTLLLVILMGSFMWWVQRDAYKQGIEMGRLLEKREQLTRHLVSEAMADLQLQLERLKPAFTDTEEVRAWMRQRG